MSEDLISLHDFIKEFFTDIIIIMILGLFGIIYKWYKSINARFETQQKCLDNLTSNQKKQSQALKRLATWLDHKRELLHPEKNIESIKPQIDEILDKDLK